jgi:hypothetical protein
MFGPASFLLFLFLFRGGFCFFHFYSEYISFTIVVGKDSSAFFDLAFENFFCNGIFQIFLDRPIQWTCSKLLVVPFLSQKIFRLVAQLNIVSKLDDAVKKLLEGDIDDLVNMFPL